MHNTNPAAEAINAARRLNSQRRSFENAPDDPDEPTVFHKERSRFKISLATLSHLIRSETSDKLPNNEIPTEEFNTGRT